MGLSVEGVGLPEEAEGTGFRAGGAAIVGLVGVAVVCQAMPLMRQCGARGFPCSGVNNREKTGKVERRPGVAPARMYVLRGFFAQELKNNREKIRDNREAMRSEQGAK